MNVGHFGLGHFLALKVSFLMVQQLQNMLFKCIYSDIIQYLNRSHADPG